MPSPVFSPSTVLNDKGTETGLPAQLPAVHDILLDQNSLTDEMRTRGNERVSVRQGHGYGCRYGTLNEANLLKTARTCCSL
jgi:hypothetical protein